MTAPSAFWKLLIAWVLFNFFLFLNEAAKKRKDKGDEWRFLVWVASSTAVLFVVGWSLAIVSL